MITIAQLCKMTGRSRQTLYQSGILPDLLPSLEIGRSKVYLKKDVDKLMAWLEYRAARIQAGEIPMAAPLLPPGETMEEKWAYIEKLGKEYNTC